MKKIKSLIFVFLAVILLTSFLNSCMTTKTSVGTFREMPGREVTYAKGKQFWLFWGFLPLGRTNVNTPGDGNCEVSTRITLGDAIIGGITEGILTSYTIKVRTK